MANSNTLAIVALAWNEGEQLRACFKSLQLLVRLSGARTLIVFDSEGDALTERVAHEVADEVVTARFVNFAAQRNRALDLATAKWVFFIDADERCTPALAHEIVTMIEGADCAAYDIPRRNIIFGREVRHAGWHPDYQRRLLVRSRSRFDESRGVHEVAIIEGPVGQLKNALIHFNYANWGQFIAKQRAYAPLEARRLRDEGYRPRLRSLVGQPLREFKRRFIDYQGYKDGFLGLALSAGMALYTTDVYRRLLRLARDE